MAFELVQLPLPQLAQHTPPTKLSYGSALKPQKNPKLVILGLKGEALVLWGFRV